MSSLLGPHVRYIQKPENRPCSITDSVKRFPKEEATEGNATSPPQNPPTNLTVVTVEGCPSFVILDWDKPLNDTVTGKILAWGQSLWWEVPIRQCIGNVVPRVQLWSVRHSSGIASPSRVHVSVAYDCQKCHKLGNDHLCPGYGVPVNLADLFKVYIFLFLSELFLFVCLFVLALRILTLYFKIAF